MYYNYNDYEKNIIRDIKRMTDESKQLERIMHQDDLDLEKDRKVTFEQGKEFANQYGMKFFETSAKESTNVQEAFVTMTKEIIKETNEKKINVNNDKNIRVNEIKTGSSINTVNCNC